MRDFPLKLAVDVLLMMSILSCRASRQRLLLAARNVSMLCFPEGGMNYDWDLTYIVDGMFTLSEAHTPLLTVKTRHDYR